MGELLPSPTVLTTMKRARTTRERIVPVGVEVIEGRMILVAAASGIVKNPQRFHNIVANPTVTVEWQGDTFIADALITEGTDRSSMCSRVNEVYRTHQAQTSRTLPVIELSRVQEPRL